MSFRIPAYAAFAAIVALMMPPAQSKADSAVKHVFELFTSQGCYSCPPAEKLLGQMVDRNDEILALEYHVDYWDTLVYGSAGQWKDPFSSPEYSQRQRDYNRLRLKGRTGVYTPQMIVDGAYAFVGSNSMHAKIQMMEDSRLVLDSQVEVSKDGRLTIRIEGDYETKADIWLVKFDRQHVTEISSGENMGKELTNWNVVRHVQSVGEWRGEPLVIQSEIEPLAENENCAVIVQEYSESRKRIVGPIIGAAKCTFT